MILEDELSARLAALIEDQERLLQVIRRAQTELARVDKSAPDKPSTPPCG
jgi:hypothetical protein